MASTDELLLELTAAVTSRDPAITLSGRLCDSYRELAGADGAAITVRYEDPARVTLCATDDNAARLEDLQDVLGEGPGHSAARSGQIELCLIPGGASPRWSIFVDAAQEIVASAAIHAIPMHPDADVFGVITLYASPQPRRTPKLAPNELKFLADVVGAALVTDGAGLDEFDRGPWASRSQVHVATGMVVAQMKISPDDALALLRAHAFAHQMTLSALASAVVERRVRFPIH